MRVTQPESSEGRASGSRIGLAVAGGGPGGRGWWTRWAGLRDRRVARARRGAGRHRFQSLRRVRGRQQRRRSDGCVVGQSDGNRANLPHVSQQRVRRTSARSPDFSDAGLQRVLASVGVGPAVVLGSVLALFAQSARSGFSAIADPIGASPASRILRQRADSRLSGADVERARPNQRFSPVGEPAVCRGGGFGYRRVGEFRRTGLRPRSYFPGGAS